MPDRRTPELGAELGRWRETGDTRARPLGHDVHAMWSALGHCSTGERAA